MSHLVLLLQSRLSLVSYYYNL